MGNLNLKITIFLIFLFLDINIKLNFLNLIILSLKPTHFNFLV